MSFREGKKCLNENNSISVYLGYIQVTPFEMLAILTKQTIQLKFLILIITTSARYLCKGKESHLNFGLARTPINHTLPCI